MGATQNPCAGVLLKQNRSLFNKTDNYSGGFRDRVLFLSEKHFSKVIPKGCLDLFSGSMGSPGPGSTNKGGGGAEMPKSLTLN